MKRKSEIHTRKNFEDVNYFKLNAEFLLPMVDLASPVNEIFSNKQPPGAASFRKPAPHPHPKHHPVYYRFHVFPDSITMDNIEFDDWGVLDVSQAPLVYAPSFGTALPQTEPIVIVNALYPLIVNYRILGGFGVGRGVVVIRGTDNTFDFVKQEVTTPQYRMTDTYKITLPFKRNFDPNLYGYHQLIIELWEQYADGIVLPYQNDIPDKNTYKLMSSDWTWIYLGAGCRGDKFGGVDFVNFKAYDFTPKQLQLDTSGRIAQGQQVTLSWTVETAALPKTMYGFYGSYGGMYIYNFFAGTPPIYVPAANAGTSSGSITIDLSGLVVPLDHNYFMLQPASTGCGPQPKIIIPLKKAVPALAEIFNTYSNWYFDDPYTAELDIGTPFNIVFNYTNIGGTATGPFTFTIYLDNAYYSSTDYPGLKPGESVSVTSDVEAGLGAGSHTFVCVADSGLKVNQSTRQFNTGSVGLFVFSI